MVKEVYVQSIEDCKLIIVNKDNQHISFEKIFTEFGNFLGALTQNLILTPFNHVNWYKISKKKNSCWKL